ncbi:hypothetical protein CEE39_00210 [bacterium (candidate division B38) B3_B38]|nr:MAG: hypothetical protein CEE39_00210 [bacterium (candidate division B38) B3_B38]
MKGSWNKHTFLMGALILTLLLFLPAASAFIAPQTPQTPQIPQTGQRWDERFKILALKRAQIILEDRRQKYERMKDLFEKQLVSRENFEKAEADYHTARVAYQEAMLNVVFDRPHVTILKAIKYQTPEGQKRVKLTLKNSSGGSFELEQLEFLQKEDPSLTAGLDLSKLTNVYVSLKSEGSIISEPYEARIPVLPNNGKANVDFLLLKDVDNVVVSINYADKLDEKQIYLQKDASANIVTMNSSQFSQEANLEGEATYDLMLERFTSESNIFKLKVINLPKQVSYEFVDTETSARLSQVKFTEGVTSKKLSLTLHLPKRADEQIVIDKKMEFYALVLDPREAEDLSAKEGHNFTKEEVEEIKGGVVELELIPKGVGKIEVEAVSLYHEIDPGKELNMEVTVRNTGTRRLDNITLKTDLPYRWKSKIEPDVIPSLMPEKEKVVNIAFYPPEDVGVGDYESKLKTEAIADNRPVETEDKTIRVHVKAKANILGSTLLVLFLVGLVVGIVVFGIRLSRR